MYTPSWLLVMLSLAVCSLTNSGRNVISAVASVLEYYMILFSYAAGTGRELTEISSQSQERVKVTGTSSGFSRGSV